MIEELIVEELMRRGLLDESKVRSFITRAKKAAGKATGGRYAGKAARAYDKAIRLTRKGEHKMAGKWTEHARKMIDQYAGSPVGKLRGHAGGYKASRERDLRAAATKAPRK